MWFFKWYDVMWRDAVLWDVMWWDVMYRDVMGPDVISITEPCGFDAKHDKSDYGEPMCQHCESILLNTLRGTQQYYDVQNVTPLAVFPLLNWRHRDLSIFFVVQSTMTTTRDICITKQNLAWKLCNFWADELFTVLDRNRTQKWLGFGRTHAGSMRQNVDRVNRMD